MRENQFHSGINTGDGGLHQHDRAQMQVGRRGQPVVDGSASPGAKINDLPDDVAMRQCPTAILAATDRYLQDRRIVA